MNEINYFGISPEKRKPAGKNGQVEKSQSVLKIMNEINYFGRSPKKRKPAGKNGQVEKSQSVLKIRNQEIGRASCRERVYVLV